MPARAVTIFRRLHAASFVTAAVALGALLLAAAPARAAAYYDKFNGNGAWEAAQWDLGVLPWANVAGNAQIDFNVNSGEMTIDSAVTY